jgi:methylmalonyl-CoA/ethylmalonyl-CoA epimerase
MTEMYQSVQEIALAVNDVEAATKRLAEVFDKTPDEIHSTDTPGIELTSSGIWFGDFRLAIVGDSTGTGPTSKLLARRGQGLSEICLRTPDLDAAIADLKAKGVRLVSDEPVVMENYEWKDGKIFSKVRIVFIHPKDMFGLQVELQEWTE